MQVRQWHLVPGRVDLGVAAQQPVLFGVHHQSSLRDMEEVATGLP